MLPYSPTHSFLSCTHDEELERREREKEYDVCGFLSRWMKGKIRTGSSLHPTHIPFARKLTHRPARKGIIRPGEWTVRSGPVISFHSLRSLIHSFPSTRSHPSLHSLTSLSLLSMSWWPKGMLGRTWRDRATLHSPTHRSSRIERWGGGLRKSGEKRRKDSEWEVRLGRSFLPVPSPYLSLSPICFHSGSSSFTELTVTRKKDMIKT